MRFHQDFKKVNSSFDTQLGSSSEENLMVSDLVSDDLHQIMDPKFKGHKGDSRSPTKKVASGKPTSVDLFNGDSDLKDLIKDSGSKQVDRKLMTQQKEALRQTQEAIQQSITTLYGQENLKTHDTVMLSGQMQASVLQTKKTQNTDKTSSVSKKESEEEGESVKSSTASSESQPMSALQKAIFNAPTTSVKAPLQQQATRQVQSQAPKAVKQEVVQQAVQNYLSTYAETLIKRTDTKKKDTLTLRKELMDMGYSTKKLDTLEKNVRHSVETDLRKQLKKSYINMALTYVPGKMTPELLETSRMLEKSWKKAENHGLSDQNIRDDMQAAKEDLKGFISDELDQAIIEAKLKSNSIESLMEAFDKFNNVAGVSRFDSGAYMRQFQSKIENLGLSYFEDPDAIKIKVLDTDTAQQGKSQNGDNQNDSGSADQQEFMEDQLRDLYTQRATKKDLKSQLGIALKLKKLKRGLTEETWFNESQDKTLQKEGEALAKIKLMELVKESLEQRATLPSLEGTEHHLIRNKLKLAIKALRDLDYDVTKQELTSMRDKINRGMFSVIREEYIKTEVQLNMFPKNLQLIQQKKQHLAILERLKQESHIEEELMPKSFQQTMFKSETQVIEAA